jgi:Lrp/AsnC family leucine-responsive transcriptional regulator
MLNELQKNARQTFAELGRKAGLSLPAAAERVRRLEDSGAILGYGAQVDAGKLGYPITAFVRLKSVPQNYARFKHVVAGLAEIMECHHVTGEDSFHLKLVASSIAHLEELVGKLSAFGQTTTSLVLSTSLSRNLAGLKPAGMLG